MANSKARKGMPGVTLNKTLLAERLKAHFYDPKFETVAGSLDRIVEVAWDAYKNSRKSPRKRRAGQGFADPDYEISVEWLATRAAIARLTVACTRMTACRRGSGGLNSVRGSKR